MSSQLSLQRLSVASLEGVGPQIANRLQKLGIRNVQDLLFYLPFRYEDRTKIVPIVQARMGQQTLIEGRVEATEVIRKNRSMLVCRISDGTAALTLKFFRFSRWQQAQLEHGVLLRCFGEIRVGYSYLLEMIHPEYHLISEDLAGHVDSSLTPVYPLTEGLSQKFIRRLIEQAFHLWNSTGKDDNTFQDWIPASILKSMNFPSLVDAIRFLHAPPNDAMLDRSTISDHPAQQCLAFEELLAHQLSMNRFRAKIRSQRAPIISDSGLIANTFLENLPFALTRAQQKIIHEIRSDLMAGSPMMRLVQGDVGSGKTVVAACTALSVLASEYQVALMAPTELLAEQHYKNFAGWLKPFEIKIELLTSKHKGKKREQILKAILEGKAGMVIGTHALFQRAVRFFRLGYVIIDEQHRFGVHQRLSLREKGIEDDVYPHQLVMTATPIPRTLAMLRFSDLDVSIIDELPPGRKPVKTIVIPSNRRDDVIGRINRWVSNGGQVYWVCTLIDESESMQYRALEETSELLQRSLPAVRLARIHGKMKATEKEGVMRSFHLREVDILVATTVIEVGVDVPNAGLMIIENPERLGLSQLHQLRGRVGRGSKESFCVLMYQPPLSNSAHQRLSIIRESNDGFVIAEKDLDLRGPGEVMGTRQTGQLQFRIADLARDRAMLPKVLEASKLIKQEYPDNIEPLIHRWIGDSEKFAEA